MKAPAVAVIVPTYNGEKVLRACLESVLAQSLRPVEVVVVDDRSTDGSLAITREFRDRCAGVGLACRLVELPVNLGPSGARNAGVAACSAELLFFVDSDTALAPDAVENAVRVLVGSPGCAMVQGIYHPEPLFDDGPVEAYQVAFEHFWRRRTVGRETATLFAASLITREAFEAAGGFDERLRSVEDDEFGTRLPERYRVVVSDAVLTRHDDVDRLGSLLREQFGRASVKPAVMLQTWRHRRAGAAGARVDMLTGARFRHLDWPARLSLALPALLLLTVPLLPFLLWLPFLPWLGLAWPGLVAGFVVANHEFLRFTRRLRGARFSAYAAGVHLLVHLALVLGLGVGVLRVAYRLLVRRGHPVEVGA